MFRNRPADIEKELWLPKGKGVAEGIKQEFDIHTVGCLAVLSQSCPTLCKPMDCSLTGSSVQGILQARILEWVAMPSSTDTFPTQGLNPGLLHYRQILYCLCPPGKPLNTGVGSLSKDLPNQGIKWRSPALQADSLPAELYGSPNHINR